MLQLKISVQLESLGAPFRQGLQRAAELGVSAVEINVRRDLPLKEMSRTAIRQVRKLLADVNLKVGSLAYPTQRGFVVADEIDRRLDGTRAAMSLAYELGAPFVVGHMGDIPEDLSSPAAKMMMESLENLAAHGQRVGARFAARQGREPAGRLQGVLEALPESTLGVDFDPASCIVHGYSATDSLRQLAKHTVSFRAADAVRDIAHGNGVVTQLGRGSVDLPQLLANLEEFQFNGFLIIAGLPKPDPVTSCRWAIEYLRSFF